MWKALHVSHTVFTKCLGYHESILVDASSQTLKLLPVKKLIPFFISILNIYFQAAALGYILVEAVIYERIKLPLYKIIMNGFIVTIFVFISTMAWGCLIVEKILIRQFFNNLMHFKDSVLSKRGSTNFQNVEMSNRGKFLFYLNYLFIEFNTVLFT